MRKPSPAMLVALLALFVALGGVGVAANGGSFILGQSNSATAQTALTGTTSAAALLVTNNGGGSPLKLQGPANKAPLIVNSTTKVASLNADQLDGQDSTAFLPVAGKAADSDKLDGKDSTSFLGTTGKAADSDKLDGKDSTAFLGTTGTAANADKLDGKDSTAFLPSTGDITFSYVGADARVVGTGVSVRALATGDAQITANTTGAKTVVLSLPAPSALFGTPLKPTSVRVCYFVTSPGSFIDATIVGMRHLGAMLQLAGDGTNESSTSETCYDESFSPPAFFDGALLVKLSLSFASTSDTIDLAFVKVGMTA